MKRFILILALCPAIGVAEVIPTPGPRDPRIQSVDYDPDQIVRLMTAPGYILVVEFSSDERIETIALGSNAHWQVTSNRRGNHLFIKQEAGALDTNMSVITDARRYSLSLLSSNEPGSLLPYTVRFNYAGVNSAPEVAVEPEQGAYRLGGARALRPVEIFDNGQATRMRWSDDAAIPAVYAIDSGGEEMIVNGAMRDGFFVVDAIASKFIFRLGKQSASATRQQLAVRP